MKKDFYLLFLFIALSLVIAACENKEVESSAIINKEGYSDVEGVSLVVGKKAPGWTLTSQEEKSVSLKDFIGQPVMLVFYRGYWCPYCIGHLEDIQSAFGLLEKKGIQLIAISPDDPEGLQRMAQRMEKPYLFLSDRDLKVSESYGIKKDDKLPHPAVVILDEEGKVFWFYVGEDYKQRPSASQLSQVISRL